MPENRKDDYMIAKLENGGMIPCRRQGSDGRGRNAVVKEWITEEQFEEITGESYNG